MTKKTIEERINEANHPIVSRKLVEVWFWQEQNETLVKTERLLAERFNINGKGTAVALACQFLLDFLEENNVKSENV